MPLPRSLTCSSCQHTYPDGWVRCPYCGFDPGKQKRDRQIERALVKRFPSYAAAVGGKGGQKNKQQSRKDRDSVRSAPGDAQSARQGEGADSTRKRSRRRRGRKRRGPATGQGATPETSTAQPQAQAHADRRPSTDRPRRTPTKAQEAGEQRTKSSGATEGQPRKSRRRRPRRRRKPQGEGGSPKSES